jgi:broad specificity phosphatase PhoE
MRLLLIRHGQTASNLAGILDSAYPGPKLTPLGHVQARAIPQALSQEKIAGLYTSPLTRTQLTAAPLAEECGLELQVLEGLAEIEAGDLEGATDTESRTAYIDTMLAWGGGMLDQVMPGAHDGHAFLKRFDDAVHQIAQAHSLADTAAVVSHGAAIRVWSAVRASQEPSAAVSRRLLNTGLVVVEGDPDAGWELTRWREEPLGGFELEGSVAHDVTGLAPAEAIADGD